MMMRGRSGGRELLFESKGGDAKTQEEEPLGFCVF